MPRASVCAIPSVVLAIFLVGLISTTASAGQLGSVTIAWSAAKGRVVTFRVESTWRHADWTGSGSLGTFDFGDGGSTQILAANVTTTFADDWVVARFTLEHTYQQNGNYVTRFTGCCRVNELLEGNGASAFSTGSIVTVNAKKPNQSPILGPLLPPSQETVPVFKVSATDDAFSIPAVEPDGQPITFSFSTAGDAGLTVNPPTGMTMTPAGIVTWDKAMLAPGLYVAQVTMTDSVGGSTTADLLFEIGGALAPLALDRTTLWSPNHFLVTISTLNTNASTCRVYSILSNEPINGLGDGDRAPDWQWTPEWTAYGTFNLRAERAADGPGRVYTVTVKCGSGTDASYLMSTVAVPSDNGKK